MDIVRKMVNLRTILIGYSLLLIGCGITEPSYDIGVKVYSNLPDEDGDGIPTLTLSDSWQTIHMIDFEVTLDGEPYEYAVVKFESNLYWMLGDTLGYIIESALSDDFVYVNYDTTYVTGFNGHEVRTTNWKSYTDDEGLTRNAIAPVKTMAGEVYILWYTVWVGDAMDEVSGNIKINLES